MNVVPLLLSITCGELNVSDASVTRREYIPIASAVTSMSRTVTAASTLDHLSLRLRHIYESKLLGCNSFVPQSEPEAVTA